MSEEAHPHGLVRLGDQPILGRDHPAIETRQGFPAARWECKVESCGELGLFNCTLCYGCQRWLYYAMCPGCQSMLRMLGQRDTHCQCLQDSLFVYGHCEDHRLFESPESTPAFQRR